MWSQFKTIMIDVYLNYHSSCTFNFGPLSTIALSKTKCLNFGWPLNCLYPYDRGKDNSETLIGTTKWWPRR